MATYPFGFLAAKQVEANTAMIDATCLNAMQKPTRNGMLPPVDHEIKQRKSTMAGV
ncbi:hypothetical protein [Phaeovulum sp.]|uniref:hypothetical protein n=1 Tax=Phaeovulum sp. TaxID=2934796 RepID=UPI0039E4EB4E